MRMKYVVSVILTAVGLATAAAQEPAKTTPRMVYDETRAYSALDSWKFNQSQLIDIHKFANQVATRTAQLRKDEQTLLDKTAEHFTAARPYLAKGVALPKDTQAWLDDTKQKMSSMQNSYEADINLIIDRALGILKIEQSKALWYTPERQRQAEAMINEIRAIPANEWERASMRYIGYELRQQMRQIEQMWDRTRPGTTTRDNRRGRGDRGRDDWQRDMAPMLQQARQEAYGRLNAIRSMSPQQAKQAAYELAQRQVDQQDIQANLRASMRELLTNPGTPSAVAFRLAAFKSATGQ